MEELLPYYERELSYSHRYSEDFTQRYPKISALLLPEGERGGDPHIEPVIEEIVRCKPRSYGASSRIVGGGFCQ